ncbi:MAG: glycine cleavage system protein H [Gammaproteobacteria bacterium]|nr:glycine cleavage system protein H [Gammaproteobacteria bacterium]
MPSVRGCDLPDELLYDVENHIWYTEMGDGNVKLGMTAVATAMAGKLVAYTPKRVGRKVRAGKSCGTLESGKWVGPAKSLAGGEVVEVNEALVSEPSLANEDPYDKGWLVILKPEEWDSVKGSLVSGSDVTAPYEAKMDSEGFGGCGE